MGSQALLWFNVVTGCATLLGVGLGWIQLRRTRTAIESARRAVEEQLNRVQADLSQYIVGIALRFLEELQSHVDNSDWKLAVVRAGDLAEHLTQLAHVDARSKAEHEESASELRQWQGTFRGVASETARWTKSMPKKWNDTTTKLSRNLGRVRRPIGVTNGRGATNV